MHRLDAETAISAMNAVDFGGGPGPHLFQPGEIDFTGGHGKPDIAEKASDREFRALTRPCGLPAVEP